MARSYEQIGTILLVPIYKLLCRRRWRLEVSVQERNALRIQKLQELWYFARAQEVFRSRLDALLPSALWVSPPALKLQVMQTQWGNYLPGRTITLNPHLVKAPRDCIDYVILLNCVI